MLRTPQWLNKMQIPDSWRLHFVEELQNLPTACHYRDVAIAVWGSDEDTGKIYDELAEKLGIHVLEVEEISLSAIDILWESLQRKYGGEIEA